MNQVLKKIIFLIPVICFLLIPVLTQAQPGPPPPPGPTNIPFDTLSLLLLIGGGYAAYRKKFLQQKEVI